jgi:gamma-glutamyltranspeptidase / glutathione hydrolase
MVVTTQRLASEVGLDILKQGGNALDAAVAVGWALAVVDPCCGNIGGGGFMLIRRNTGEEVFLNFRERAPLKATPGMYLDASGNVIPGKSIRGFAAVGVPGTVAGLERARERYGTMDRERLLAPAIRLAEEGFVLGPGDAALLALPINHFAEEANLAAIFLKDGKPYAAGDRLVQKDLAATLERIARDGADEFYRGPIAEKLVAASAANGGLLSREDLASYSVTELPPVHCRYRGYQIASAPPPSSGGVALCEILNVLEGYPLAEWGFHTPRSLHVTIEAERQAYADRNASLGDPDFVHNPVAALLDAGYAARIRERIPADRAVPSDAVKSRRIVHHEGESTTHYSVVDAEGNAVAVTYSINAFFGAQVIAPDTGFLLNDTMDDFSAKPGASNLYRLVEGRANAIAPGKRPLSSMSPTIVTRDGKLFLVAGSPGGSRIITITLGVLQNVIDYRMSVQQAVDAPRVHHQWLPDVVSLEPGALPADVRVALESEGYTLAEEPRTWGAAEAILVDPSTGALRGANDRRRPAGGAAGW